MGSLHAEGGAVSGLLRRACLPGHFGQRQGFDADVGQFGLLRVKIQHGRAVAFDVHINHRMNTDEFAEVEQSGVDLFKEGRIVLFRFFHIGRGAAGKDHEDVAFDQLLGQRNQLGGGGRAGGQGGNAADAAEFKRLIEYIAVFQA